MVQGEPSVSGARVPLRRRWPRGRKFSEVLREVAAQPGRQQVSVGDLLSAMGDRAIGALMLVFALPNVLPTPPGTSGILGIPLIFLSAQLALGQRPWLPKLIARRGIGATHFAALTERASPWLARAERLLTPRLSFLVQPPSEYLIGVVCFLLAIVLVLPIPLGNILPAASICLFSFGILERDGAWIIAGLLTAIASFAVVAGVVFALVKAAIFVLANAFD